MLLSRFCYAVQDEGEQQRNKIKRDRKSINSTVELLSLLLLLAL